MHRYLREEEANEELIPIILVRVTLPLGVVSRLGRKYAIRMCRELYQTCLNGCKMLTLALDNGESSDTRLKDYGNHG